MAKMKVNFVSGLTVDSVVVTILDNSKKDTLFQESYFYGENASYNRGFEKIAKRDHETAERCGWKGVYPLKPFIGDILRDLIETYYIGNDDIEYTGYNVYAGRTLTDKEVQKRVNAIAEEV